MATTYVKLDSYTVGAGGASSITFTNISQGYTDLVIKASLRSSISATNDYGYLQFNGDTGSNYAYKQLAGNSNATSASTGTSTGALLLRFNAATSASNVFGDNEVIIPKYVANANKVATSLTASSNSASGASSAILSYWTTLWSNTSPITSILLAPASGTFVQYSTVTLYGVFNTDVSAAPTTPTIGTATAGSQVASITFTGVSGAASYTMTSSPGSITGTGTSSPVIVRGLTSGTSYTFTAKANNPLGSSSSSSASNSATPVTAMGYMDFNVPGFTTFTKLDMALETVNTVSIGVTNEAAGMASNSGVSGYRFGTTTDPKTANQKYSYSTEAVSNLANALPQARQYATGQSNSGTAAYITGGATTSFTTRYRTVVKMPFSTEAFTTLGTSFTQMGNANGVASDNHTAGYTFGGESDSPQASITDINKINYSNDAISSNIASMPLAGRSNWATSNDGTAAYFGNGNGGTNAIYKMLYSNNAVSTLSATLAGETVLVSWCYRYQTAGYIGGNYNGSTGSTAIQKITYSSEARTTISATLATAAYQLGLGENSNNGVI